MTSGIELYAERMDNNEYTNILLVALPSQDIEKAFDGIYELFSRARETTGGALIFNGIDIGDSWPPVVDIVMKDVTRKGYRARIAGPEKEIGQCLRELQAMGYQTI